jgi:uncharacterized membrane protein YkgB
MEQAMNSLIKKPDSLIEILASSRVFKSDFDYHLVRGSMVFVFLMFGYQKWFEYEAITLKPFFSHGPLIFWMPSVFGDRGASWFLGGSEWLFAALLVWGFWNKKAGILGALGCCFAMIGTVTIVPFMPDGWDAAAGFPAMKGNVAFLMKDVVLLAASFYLLKQDLVRAALSADERRQRREVGESRTRVAGEVAGKLHAEGIRPAPQPGRGGGGG